MKNFIPVAYILPFTFLGIFTDYLSFTIIGYIVFGVMLITLNSLSIGQYKVVIVLMLNIVSMTSSIIFSIYLLNSNEQAVSYFKPETPVKLIVIYTVIIYFISILIAKLLTYVNTE